MVRFIVMVLKWLAALAVAYVLLFVLAMLLLVGIAVSFQPVPAEPEKNSVLVLDLGFDLTEQPASDTPMQILRQALQGQLQSTASLRQVIETLGVAKLDPDIHGLLIKGSLVPGSSGGSFAALRELRGAIGAFGASKPVWAYLEGDGMRELYVKSAATRVIGNPFSGVDFRGLRAERMYLGEAFTRMGIDFQVEALEEFKTAAEAFQRGSMSDEERLQLDQLLGELWAVIITDMAQSRGLEPAALDRLAETEMILHGQEVKDSGLADELMTEDRLIEHLATAAGFDREGKSFRQFDFLDYVGRAEAAANSPLAGTSNKIGIVYAEGMIVDGEGDETVIGADRLVGFLREMRQDAAVKAVVLRINSPGGSATASLKVVREIQLTHAEKPVIVSMGGMAASGGYMIAVAGGPIFAEPSTITGSIGVVMMLPNVEQLADKLSVRFEGVETHPFAGSFSLAREKNPEEMRQIRELAGIFYEDFIALVAQGRGMEIDRVRELAKGRVWSGLAAHEAGLVDEQGGLMAAVQRAADMAGIGDDYSVTELPQPQTLEQRIIESLASAVVPRMTAGRHGPLRALWRDVEAELADMEALNDPHGLYLRLPYTLQIR